MTSVKILLSLKSVVLQTCKLCGLKLCSERAGKEEILFFSTVAVNCIVFRYFLPHRVNINISK